MFKQFPREVGPPRKVVHNMKDYLKYVNTYNGMKKAVYTSVYHFGIMDGYRPLYESAIIDKIYFDFDDKECDAWHEANKLHQYCLQEDLKHFIIMSGRGYHVYIFCNIYIPIYTKATIYNAQHIFIDKLDLKVDAHVIGNAAQLARVPNTFNGKAKLFCIPLSRDIFEKGDSYVKELAKKQNFKSEFIGTKKMKLEKLDFETTKEFNCDIEIKDDIENLKLPDKIPPCIKQILIKKIAGWKDRYLLILYFKEMGYSQNEVNKILKQYLSERKYNHCVREEKQLQYLFSRKDLMFPICENINLDGKCVKKCSQYNNVIYKM